MIGLWLCVHYSRNAFTMLQPALQPVVHTPAQFVPLRRVEEHIYFLSGLRNLLA
jgi:hypothetical protein